MNEKRININLQRFNLIGGCVGCMSRGRKMFYNERIHECFRALAGIYIPKDVTIHVCWECSAYINNIFRFKSTIERSYRVLLDYSMNHGASDGLLEDLPGAQQRLETFSCHLVDVNELSVEPKEEDIEIIKHEIDSDFGPGLGFLEEDMNGEIFESYSSIKPATYETILKDCEVRLIRLGHLQNSEVQPISNQSQDLFRSDQLNHMDTNTFKTEFCCKLCSYKCYEEKDLHDHEKSHVDEYLPEIISSYKTKTNKYFYHNIIKHTVETPFACVVCSFKSSFKASLNRHLKTHTGEKPYTCDICSYEFTCKRDLNVHLRTHTGEKPFACDICSYKCIQKSNLNDHMKTHTGEKPYACNICTFKCIQKSNLNVHMKTHTG